MNRVELIGRITSKPELRYTNNNKAYTRFSLAINREYTKDDGSKEADFINIVAWDKRAEVICKYVQKGNRIGITGRIQTGSYDKEDGSKGYLTDVIADGMEFLESKPKEEVVSAESEPELYDDPFSSFGSDLEITDNDLPF